MTSPRVQTPRNAWINALREEALREHRPEVSKAAHIGVWIATYADADGGNAFPSGETLAAIAGCTRDTVIRCVRLLVAVGMLTKQRRPNKPAVYQLVIPMQRPDWAAHMHVWGESRQAAARRKAKEKEMTEHLARKSSADDNGESSGDDNRKSSADDSGGGPEVVRGGASGSRPGTTTEGSGSRPRTPPEVAPGRLPEVVPGGGDQYPLPKGRDPHPDHDVSGSPTQPDTRAGEGEPNDDPFGEDERPAAAPAALRHCAGCGEPMLPRPGRERHAHCQPAAPAAEGDAT